MKESIKQLLLSGGIISHPYKSSKKGWFREVKLFILIGPSIDDMKPKVYLEAPTERKSWEISEVDEAIDSYMEIAFNSKNLAWIPVETPSLIPKKLAVEFDGPFPLSETEEGYIAKLNGFKIVEAGRTKQEAFDELIVSVGVLLAYNSGMELKIQRTK